MKKKIILGTIILSCSIPIITVSCEVAKLPEKNKVVPQTDVNEVGLPIIGLPDLDETNLDKVIAYYNILEDETKDINDLQYSTIKKDYESLSTDFKNLASKRIKGIGADFIFSKWKWIEGYLPKDEPAKEENFKIAISHIKSGIDWIISHKQPQKIAKAIWGYKFYGTNPEFDPMWTRKRITKQFFISTLKKQLGNYNDGYDYYINPLIDEIEKGL